jgi:hypothetical protein
VNAQDAKRSANGGKRFEKGTSGNPARRFGQPDGNPTDRGGRPQSLAVNIRAKVGDDGDALVCELLVIAKDRRRSAWGRVQAIRELLDRGFGTSPQIVKIEPGTEDRQRFLLRFATDEELTVMEELNNRLEARARDAALTTRT